jgi:A1 cistron-splicing factor AAR2
MATQRRIEEKGKAKVEEEPRDGSATDTLGHKSYYTDIPKRAIPPGAAPHEVTRYSIDKSYMLTLLLETKYENGTTHTPPRCPLTQARRHAHTSSAHASTSFPILVSADRQLAFPILDQALLLGELEYSFVCFVMGQEYEGFVQWKKLVNLMCSCEEALLTHPGLFHEFIGTTADTFPEASAVRRS